MPTVPDGVTLSEASDLIRSRQLSAAALVEYFLTMISTLDGAIRAWVRIDGEGALGSARTLDQLLASGTWLGPLHGIPIGVKDIYDVAGLPTEAGSSLRKGVVPGRDAVSVRRLKRAGAIVLGKTVTTELGHSVPGPTRNPWNIDHTPGGSSSGSAAAVAAHMCLGALGSQTLGSIIRPAAYCGIVGLKATYGLINRVGILPLAPTLDTPGPMARTVRDAMMLFEAIAEERNVGRAPVQGTGFGVRGHEYGVRPTIGIPTEYFTSADSGTQICFEQALDALKRLGMKLVHVPLPTSFNPAVRAAQVVTHVEAAALHVDLYRQRGEQYSSGFRRTIERGLMIPAVSYVRAQQIRRRALSDMRNLFRQVNLDVLVTPATAGPAPAGLSSTGDASFNTPFTALGMPVMTVPMGFVRDLPVGLQIAGNPFAEATVFAVAAAYEAATGWMKQRPSMSRTQPTASDASNVSPR